MKNVIFAIFCVFIMTVFLNCTFLEIDNRVQISGIIQLTCNGLPVILNEPFDISEYIENNNTVSKNVRAVRPPETWMRAYIINNNGEKELIGTASFRSIH